jgi:hypothetical protein
MASIVWRTARGDYRKASAFIVTLAACTVWLSLPAAAWASTRAEAAEEAAQYVLSKFGREAVKESADALAERIAALAAKHGDEAIVAVRKVGPSAFKLIEDAGENAPQAVALLAKMGDEAVWVVAQPRRLALAVKYGDEAATAMAKHKDIADDLITALGKPAAEALNAVSGEQARRLAMLTADGDLARIGREKDLLGVVGKYGDRAMDFIWRNKGALAVSAALTAFLADPEPFINGTKDLAKIGADAASAGPKELARAAAEHTNWTLIIGLTVLIVGGIVALTMLRKRRHRA